MDIHTCGLSGYDCRKVKLSTERKVALVAVLMSGNDTRGDDSSGYFNPLTGESFHKLGGLAEAVTKFYKLPFLFTHHRKATTGAITIPNAHPFDIGNVVGAHNGMITNHEELNRKYDRKHEVDSMHIFSHLDEGRDFSDISGYGAIEFIRKDDPTKIHLCRLSGGDLSIFGIGEDDKNYQGVIWSSDEDHAKAALTAANIKAFPFQIDAGVVYFVKNGMLYKSEEKLEFAPRSYVNHTVYRGFGHDSDEGDYATWWERRALTAGAGASEKKSGDSKDLWDLSAESDSSGNMKNEGGKYDDKELAQNLEDLFNKETGISDEEERRFTHALNGDLEDDEIPAELRGIIGEDKVFVDGRGFISKDNLTDKDIEILNKR